MLTIISANINGIYIIQTVRIILYTTNEILKKDHVVFTIYSTINDQSIQLLTSHGKERLEDYATFVVSVATY